MRIKPKKRLGQNFLVDKNIQRKIIEACQFKKSDIVLEIGSGRGELTSLIAENSAKVYALEIDLRLSDALKVSLKEFMNITVINADILKFNIGQFFNKIGKKIKVAGNIPYYISTPIIERLIQFRANIDEAFITVQKEFAERMNAGEGTKKYGSLSCFVQYYTRPKALFNIKKGSFLPMPKVDSTLLKLEFLPFPAVKVEDQNLFFKIIRSGFNQRRKMLKNSLSGIVSGHKLRDFFIRYNLNPNSRPENLSLKDFANLANLHFTKKTVTGK